jgi:muramidase (phage lysozyme)
MASNQEKINELRQEIIQLKKGMVYDPDTGERWVVSSDFYTNSDSPQRQIYKTDGDSIKKKEKELATLLVTQAREKMRLEAEASGGTLCGLERPKPISQVPRSPSSPSGPKPTGPITVGLAPNRVVLTKGADGVYTLAMKGGSPHVRALLRVLSVGEGTKGPTSKCHDPYKIVYGGGCDVGDEYKHPKKAVKKGKWTSSAAGRYQMLYSTWAGKVNNKGVFKKGWAQKYAKNKDIGDFTPQNQDWAVYNLLVNFYKLKPILESGDFEGAVKKIKKIWASLPGSGHGQPEVKMTRIKKIYDKLLQEELGATS